MKSISTPYDAKFSVFVEFHDFQVFAFGYRVWNEKPDITEKLYFLDLSNSNKWGSTFWSLF